MVLQVFGRLPLIIEAKLWRGLMAIGMALHKLAKPRPLKPTFYKSFNTTLSPHPGKVRLVFYCPKGYNKRGDNKQYPCIVNFHGGGFTIGTATDDARWATAVVEECDAIVCSVDYRRAPEHPFPTAVEDGADAIMWIWDHAAELRIDGDKMGTSGFSAGGNMCISTTLRLQDALLRRRGAEPPNVSSDAPVVLEHEHKVVKIIIAWYPSIDFTRPRDERRKTNTRPDKELPRFFTKLFDKSYLHPPKTIQLDSPYLSPGVAPDSLLEFLPENMAMFCCEWDELLAEGIRFRDRLLKLGKNVHYRMVEGVPHGWDRSPNPFHEDQKMREAYKEACGVIKQLFYGD